MAKDAKGHGSDSRGGGSTADNPGPRMRAVMANNSGYSNLRAKAEAMKADNDRSFVQGGVPLRQGGWGGSGPPSNDAWSSTPGGDREAADVMASGPKSDPVPVHDSMTPPSGFTTGDGRTHADFGSASAHANSVFQKTGNVISVEKSKPSLSSRRAASLARVSY